MPRILKPREGHPYPQATQLPADEIGDWVPAPTEPTGPEGVVIPAPRPGEATQLKPGDDRTRALASAGGRAAKARRDQLKAITGLGISEASKLMTDPEYAEYVEAALAFVKHEIARLARDVGGGTCPPPAAACVIDAARAMIFASKAAGECDGKAAVQFGAAMKQQLLCAHEFCVAEAKLRRSKKSSHSKIEEGLEALERDEE